MKSNMWKSTFREIKQSFGRFMAIFSIVALGVSLFSGLKVIQSAMVQTTDEYLREKTFYNYRVISTLGYEQEDVDFLAARQDVRMAEGAVTFDILCKTADNSEMVMKTFNLPENIGSIELMAGRMPEAADECIADSHCFTQEAIGQKLTLSDTNAEDDLEKFAYGEYTIVGIAQSPNYIQFERGNTSLGNGRIAGFLYLPMEGFDTDFFTEILVKFDEDYKIYSDEYDAFMDEKESEWEELAQEAADHRYDRIMKEAEAELADANQEFEEKKAEAETELEDAKIELADAKKELEDGDKKIAEGKKELADGRKELEDGRDMLEKNRARLHDAEQEIASGTQELEAGDRQLEENRKLLEEKEAQAAEGRRKLEEGQIGLDEQKIRLAAAGEQLTQVKESVKLLREQLDACKEQLGAMTPEQQKEVLAPLEQGIDALLSNLEAMGTVQEDHTEAATGTETQNLTADQRVYQMEAKLTAAEEAIAAQEAVISEGLVQLEKAQAELDVQREKLDEADKQLASAKEELSAAQAQTDASREELELGKRQVKAGWSAFSQGEAELAKAEGRLADGETELLEKEKELADGWKEYRDGLEEYQEGYQEYIEEIAEGEAKIADAKQEIADIEKPETYVLGRETNIGYVCFENDSAIVDGIANVFPVFFFAVAALVCITTMNRMVEEQRTQIGILKALGYSRAAIMGKYLFYSGTAAITGCILGYFFGTWFFPKIIWAAYGSMYDVDDIVYVFDGGLLIFSLAVSAACSMGTTYLTCRKEFSEVAAELMRPKAPKAGKRVVLEQIPFLWKRMKFLHKVSYRNVFRYKKRFFMMVIGIGGCTGLLLTGFGIRDSIANIANDQYDRIQIYDVNVMLADEVTGETKALLQNVADGRVKDALFVMEKAIDLVTEDSIKTIDLVAVDEEDDISAYVTLKNEMGDVLTYPKNGECILSRKIADTYELKIGDHVKFVDENNHEMELTLSGITENYLYNYVYMTTETYEQYLGEKAVMKSVYMNVKDDVDSHKLSADLMKEDKVASATVLSDSKERFTSMIQSLNLIVAVIIICAAFLAFIVLYNLTNINITERIREIATIKVLGFYKNETASYIFRENLILTSIGALAGLFLGNVFHAFVMSQIQVDQVAFAVRILPMSYLYSILLTFLFAFVVNLFMSGKLENVSMTESLKSVD